jgi:hypothetical protein
LTVAVAVLDAATARGLAVTSVQLTLPVQGVASVNEAAVVA